MVKKPKLPDGGIDAISSTIKEVSNHYFEYKKVKEHEQTNRAEIKARRDVAIEAIQSQREIILYSLEKTFEQRGKSLDKMFEGLDHALENDNMEQIDRFLGGIVTTVQSSPFKDFGDFQKSLSQGNHVLKLD